MLTKQDKKYLNKTFATKEQLTQQALDIGTEFERIRDEFGIRAVEVDARFDQMDDRFDKIENLMKSLIGEVLVEVRGANERVDKVELYLGLAVA